MSLSTSPFVSFILVHVSSWHKAGKHVSLDYAILAYLINSPKPYFIGNLSKLNPKNKNFTFYQVINSVLFFWKDLLCKKWSPRKYVTWRYIYIYIYHLHFPIQMYIIGTSQKWWSFVAQNLCFFFILRFSCIFDQHNELCNSALDKERIFLAATTWTANFKSPVF